MPAPLALSAIDPSFARGIPSAQDVDARRALSAAASAIRAARAARIGLLASSALGSECRRFEEDAERVRRANAVRREVRLKRGAAAVVEIVLGRGRHLARLLEGDPRDPIIHNEVDHAALVIGLAYHAKLIRCQPSPSEGDGSVSLS